MSLSGSRRGFAGTLEHVEQPHPPSSPVFSTYTTTSCCVKARRENESTSEGLCCRVSSIRCPSMALSAAWFLLTLASLSAASAPDCQELVQPYMPEEPEQLFGKWIYVMGAGDPVTYHKALEYMKSSWIELHPTSDNLTVTLRWGDYCFNRCIFGNVNATVSGLTATFRKNLSDHKGHLLQTCSGCLLWTDSFRNMDVTGRYIMQFTRTGKIDPKDVEHFKTQAKCLNFPENFHSYDSTAELCPDNKKKTTEQQ